MTISTALRRFAEYSGRAIAVAALFVVLRPNATFGEAQPLPDQDRAVLDAEDIVGAIVEVDVDEGGETPPSYE